MPVWVRIKVRRPGESDEVEASAKVNTGFTVGPLPVIRLPKALAERLGFNIEESPEIAGVVDGGGRPLPMRRLGLVEVKISLPDRETEWVRAVAVYLGPATHHILINDALTEKLDIMIIRPLTGLWRLVDDPPDLVRESARPEYFSS